MATTTGAPDDEWDDETYPESPATSTDTIASFMFDYEEENGRTYHAYKAGKYWGANDGLAQDHEELSHELYFESFGSHSLCPFPNPPSRILDLGTGTGLWAQAMADRFENALITGTDLSPIQPGSVSPNLFFLVEDIETEMSYDDNTFDLVHIRGLDGSIRNWRRLFARCFQVLKPGGFVEHAEYSIIFTCLDGSIPHDGALAMWNQLLTQSHQVSRVELHAITRTADRIADAGFDELHTVRNYWPIGKWSSDPYFLHLGQLNWQHVQTGLENWALRRLTRTVGWTREEVMVLCAHVRRELDNPDIHAMQEIMVVYGRKPDPAR